MSLYIRETNIKANNLCAEERKQPEVKPKKFKSMLTNCTNTAHGPDGISYQMIKHPSLETIEILAQTIQKSIHLGLVPASPLDNYDCKNDSKIRKRSQNDEVTQTIIINILPFIKLGESFLMNIW